MKLEQQRAGRKAATIKRTSPDRIGQHQLEPHPEPIGDSPPLCTTPPETHASSEPHHPPEIGVLDAEPSLSSSSSSSPSMSPPSLRKLQPSLPPSRMSSMELIQEAAAFLYAEEALKRRRREKLAKKSRPAYDEVVLEHSGCREISDYYAKYDPAKAKRLIDALFLPRQQICPKCARFDESPVYSDRFVYKRQPLLAKEVVLLQTSPDCVVFRSTAAGGRLHDAQHFMPICTLAKPSAAGILYEASPLPAEPDLKLRLEPSILLLEGSHPVRGVEHANYRAHRGSLDKGYSRVSRRGGVVQPIFTPSQIKDVCLEFKLSLDREIAARRWANERDVDGGERQTSLLLLEPLLLVSSETSDRKVKFDKERLEQLKLIKIVVAYILIFVLLLGLTFYVVYFR